MASRLFHRLWKGSLKVQAFQLQLPTTRSTAGLPGVKFLLSTPQLRTLASYVSSRSLDFLICNMG